MNYNPSGPFAADPGLTIVVEYVPALVNLGRKLEVVGLRSDVRLDTLFQSAKTRER